MSAREFSRRDFVSATGSAAAFSWVAPTGGQAASLLSEPANVRQFGAVGDGLQNDTAAFVAALAMAQSVLVPAGTYLVDSVAVPEGRSILTEGFHTVFRQRRGLGADVRLLNIIGSNVSIGDCTVAGNIDSDTGEQRHGIIVAATERTGNLTNVSVGSIHGWNLRGDVVYVGARDGRSVSDIRIGNVHASNILRNVVSVVGGQRIRIGNITGTNVGYTHLDIEPDDWNGPVIDCFVESVRGGFVQVAGQTSEAFVDRVRIGLLDLTAPEVRSYPLYPPGLEQADALTVRNVRFLFINRLVASGFNGAAVRQVWSPGAIDDQKLSIGEAELNDCAKQPRLASAYIQGDRRVTRLNVHLLTAYITRPGVDVLRDCKSAQIGRLSSKRPKGSRPVVQSNRHGPIVYGLLAGSAALSLYSLSRRRRG